MNFHFPSLTEWRTKLPFRGTSVGWRTHCNSMTVSKDKCTVLWWGWHNPMHWYRLGMDWVGSSSTEKAWEPFYSMKLWSRMFKFCSVQGWQLRWVFFSCREKCPVGVRQCCLLCLRMVMSSACHRLFFEVFIISPFSVKEWAASEFSCSWNTFWTKSTSFLFWEVVYEKTPRS